MDPQASHHSGNNRGKAIWLFFPHSSFLSAKWKYIRIGCSCSTQTLPTSWRCGEGNHHLLPVACVKWGARRTLHTEPSGLHQPWEMSPEWSCEWLGQGWAAALVSGAPGEVHRQLSSALRRESQGMFTSLPLCMGCARTVLSQVG